MASTYCHSLSIVYYLHIEVYDMNIDKISWIFCNWMLLWQFSCFLDILVPLAGTLRLVSIFLRWKVWCLWGPTHWFFSRSEELLEEFFGDVFVFWLKVLLKFLIAFQSFSCLHPTRWVSISHAGWSIKSAPIFFRLCWPVSVVPRLSKVSRRSWIDPKIRWEDRFSHCIHGDPDSTWDLLDWTDDKIGFVTSLRWIEVCSLHGICSGTQGVEIQNSLR